ncbi:MAG: ThiF family adenylyltransferase [Pirellulales bacterium]|nr:ThiF family adenylyltransferase [Pirellulales bacterium]
MDDNQFQIANFKLQTERYIRQSRFAPLGEDGQRRLMAGRALVCGCGALGSAIANALVRAGAGLVRIVDRDFVELSNLQRQSLFDEQDAAAGTPKAVAAAEKLRRINSTVAVEPVVADVNPMNVECFCEGIDAILDGTDNFETRFLLNDVAVKSGIPWIYGGCVGAEGQTMTILPGETPCLGCLMETCPPWGSTPTCDTAGILGPIVGVIASIQAMEAIKILSGNRAAVSKSLTAVDLWQNRIRQIDVQKLLEAADCPTCKRREFPWLAGREGSRTAVLCGRNAVQITPPRAISSLDELAARLSPHFALVKNAYLLRFRAEDCEITLFADGRAIVSGTDDIGVARSIYAKYIGA